MAGQIGLIFITDWGIVGLPGMILAMIISTPISMALGWLCGKSSTWPRAVRWSPATSSGSS